MPQSSQEGVFRKTVRGASWIVLNSIVQKALGVVTFLVLARFLGPEEFGVMAVAFMVMTVFETATTPGFEKALMQQPREIAERYIDTVWTFHLLKSLLVAFLIFVAAIPIAEFFHIESHVGIIRLSAIFLLIPNFGNGHQFYFIKDFRFDKMFARDMVSQVGYIVGVFSWICMIGPSVWALAIGHLIRFLLGTIMSYVLADSYARPSFHFGRLRELMHYSKWVAGQNVLGYVLGIIDGVYIGRLLSVTNLGIYAKARDLSYSFVSPFFTVINKIGLQSYAEIQEQRAKIQEGFLRTLDMLLSVTVPVFLLLLAEGGMITELLLGRSWLGMVMPLKIMAFTTIISSLVLVTRPIFDAVARPDLHFRLNVVQLISSLVAVYVGIHWYGLNGAAWGMLFVWSVVLLVAILSARPILRMGWDMVWPTIVSIGGAVGVVLLIAVPLYLAEIPDTLPLYQKLLLLAGIGVLYAGALWWIGLRFPRSPQKTFFLLWKEFNSLRS